MDAVVVGLCTLVGIALAVGFTRAGLEVIISLIPARNEPGKAATSEPAGAEG